VGVYFDGADSVGNGEVVFAAAGVYASNYIYIRGDWNNPATLTIGPGSRSTERGGSIQAYWAMRP